MTKHLKKIFFAISLIMLTLTLASCGATPKFNLENASENLRERGYYVNYNDDYDDADDEDMMLKETLTASKNGEYVQIYKFNDLRTAKLYYKALKTERNYEIKALKYEIKIMRHFMIRYAFKLEAEDFEDIMEEIKDLQDEIKELKKENVVGRIGNTVWHGTKEAIEDTK